MNVLDFRVTSSQVGSTAIIAISGELDIHTVDRLAARLQTAIADDGCSVVVDLLDTTLLDSAGLGVLASAARRIRSTGGTFVLVADDPRLLRTLRITALDRLFEVEPSLTEAVERVVERTPAGVY